MGIVRVRSGGSDGRAYSGAGPCAGQKTPVLSHLLLFLQYRKEQSGERVAEAGDKTGGVASVLSAAKPGGAGKSGERRAGVVQACNCGLPLAQRPDCGDRYISIAG